jgi:hypothetical protein
MSLYVPDSMSVVRLGITNFGFVLPGLQVANFSRFYKRAMKSGKPSTVIIGTN